MANRFWIGGTGTWDASSTTHWSATTGGSSGASVPTSADSVFFDANSFSGAGQTVTLSATGNCLDMVWSGATNTPALAGSASLNIYGSLTFIAAMSCSFSVGSIQFTSTTSGRTITTNGLAIAAPLQFISSGGWTLQDNLSITGVLTYSDGALSTNGKAVSASQFLSSGSGIRTLTLGASIISLNGNWTLSATNLTFNVGTSTISMNGGSFGGGGLTYNNLTITSTTGITGSNTFATLTIPAGKILKPTSGTTQTFTTLSAMGTLGNVISIQSSIAGTPATISRNGGVVTFNYCSIKDITATGGATFNAYNSTDVSGNTGINFLGGDPPLGYTHKIMGQLITKVNGVTPSKVIGV